MIPKIQVRPVDVPEWDFPVFVRKWSIAQRANVSKPVVYEHFGGKEGLYAVVVDREMSALLDGAASKNCVRKSGPAAAWKFMVSARLKLPCMPWPWRSTVSATWTEQLVGSSQPDDQERKLTTIDGCGVTALPLRPSCDIGSVPEKRPNSSSTKMPLT